VPHAVAWQAGAPGRGPRKIYLLQRKTSKVGDGLGKTTGWIHRTGLKNKGVEMIPGVHYRKVDDAGLHITVDDKDMTCRWTTSSSAPARTPTASCRPRWKRKACACT
jgi:hypothetical protein